MRYLLLDRVLRLEANKHVHAIKNVALSEDVYNEHFFGFPVMPGALQIEALAQATTALLEVSANYEKKGLLIIVNHAKFRALVHPGDQLSINATVLSCDGDVAHVEGTIHVAERLVMEAKLVFALKDADTFYPPKSKHLVETTYDFLLRDAELIGVRHRKAEDDG